MKISAQHHYKTTLGNPPDQPIKWATITLISIITAVAFAVFGFLAFSSGVSIASKLGFTNTDAIMCFGVGTLLLGTVPSWIERALKAYNQVEFYKRQDLR